MARDYSRRNGDIWGDPDMRGLPFRRRTLGISTKVWSDPEFTSLTYGAHFVWTALMTSPAAFKDYDRSTFLELSGINMTQEQVDACIDELLATKYRNALKRRLGRPHISAHIRREVSTQNLRVLCRSCNSRRGARV